MKNLSWSIAFFLTFAFTTVVQSSEIHEAAAKGDLIKIKELLRKDPELINSRDDKLAATPLYFAASNGNDEVVRYLINQKANLDVPNISDFTPLMAAIQRSHSSTAALLIDAGANVNTHQRGQQKMFALFLAVRDQNTELVDLLLKHKADTNMMNVFQLTSLHEATVKENLDIIKMLLKHGANVNSCEGLANGTPLHKAKSATITTILIEHGADVNSINDKEETPLHLACRYGYKNIAEVLVSHGANLDARDAYGVTPLFYVKEHPEMHNLFLAKLLPQGTFERAENETDEALILQIKNEPGSIKKRNPDGNTLLHWGATKGRTELGNFLIQEGADIGSRNEQGQTPLYLAALNDQNKMVELLLSKGADIEARNNEGEPILFHFVRAGNEPIVLFLLEKGADANAKSENCRDDCGCEHVGPCVCGNTPLHGAAKRGQVEICKLLLAHGAEVNAKGYGDNTPIHYAAHFSRLDVVKLFVTDGADLNAMNKNDSTPLLSAFEQLSDAERGWILNGKERDKEQQEQIARYLVEHGAEFNIKDKRGATPLQFAADNYSLFAFFVAKSADINFASRYGWTALRSAANAGNLQACQLLLDKGAILNSTEPGFISPIIDAAGKGHLEIVQLYLDRGADANWGMGVSSTPLHLAVQGGHLEVVQLLIRRGADVNAKTATTGYTPLQFAVQGGFVDIINLLLDHGAKPNEPESKYGFTPLHLAARFGRSEEFFYNRDLFDRPADMGRIIDLLVTHGARVNATDIEGRTPLHLWAIFRVREDVRLLLATSLIDHGADINALDNCLRTPLTLALESQNQEAVDFLLQHGAVEWTQDYLPGCASFKPEVRRIGR